MKKVILTITICCLCLPCIAQSQKPVITVLGMVHLHNPGADEVNMDMGDILSNKKQAELKQLIDLVARFKPTKIAIEKPREDTLWSQIHYNNYRNGILEKEVSENDKWRIPGEVVQLSYPLAKRMNLDKLYPIDATAEFDIEPVIIYAKQNNQYAQLEEFKKFIENIEKDIKSMSKGTVLDIIRFVNSTEFDKNYNQNFYLKHLVSFGTDNSYIGTDVVAGWYTRNLRIFTNLNRIITPEDRVLVIYGAGHKDILVDLIKDRTDWEYYDINQVLNYNE
ncbi:DUF5694 domain-containing protein [Aquimarina sediminis]|uniref:DUF5694 domain-containing protein n=1 Tax=Aquimarina sediminis TaxID=2070536 RepID=UPI000FFF39BC|nr:DUF5694 domain-containing protein [Aquimarina sediminis]